MSQPQRTHGSVWARPERQMARLLASRQGDRWAVDKVTSDMRAVLKHSANKKRRQRAVPGASADEA